MDRPSRLLVVAALALGALTVLALAFVAVPVWFVPDSAPDLYTARNDVRTTAIQATAGLMLLLGAYFTWRQVQNTTRTLDHTREQLEVARRQAEDSDRHAREQLEVARQGQVTERFTRAIDQIGSPDLDIRLGGIYALERIARDSEIDRPTIGEILTAYIRTHSPWPPTRPGQGRANLTLDQILRLPDLHTRLPDVQAALTVLGRGGFAEPITDAGRLNLRMADLRRAGLAAANLQRADLVGANLDGADLRRANLEGAHLVGANLAAAMLVGANLEGANLDGARLKGAMLVDANLERTDLTSARLEEAVLNGARLEGAVGTRLTVWPNGFDWQASGARVRVRVRDIGRSPREGAAADGTAGLSGVPPAGGTPDQLSADPSAPTGSP